MENWPVPLQQLNTTVTRPVMLLHPGFDGDLLSEDTGFEDSNVLHYSMFDLWNLKNCQFKKIFLTKVTIELNSQRRFQPSTQ